MGKLKAFVVIGVVIFAASAAAAAAAAPAADVDTRTFTGTGSVGRDSSLELYLLEGTYRHRLAAACYTAASVFPARPPNGVPLSDVLDADLSVGTARSSSSQINPTGSLTISLPGWVNLQVGTGSECEWAYAITGQFLPEGEEPVPPSQRSQWWLPVAGVVAVLALVILVWRRKPAQSPPEDDPVRVLDGS